MDATEPNNAPPPRLPTEPLRRIDWMAVAPWLLLFKAPEAMLGWPLALGLLGSVVLGGFGADASLPGSAVALSWQEGAWRPPLPPSLGFNKPTILYSLQMLGWAYLGAAMTSFSWRALVGANSGKLVEVLKTAYRPALVALAAVAVPLVLAGLLRLGITIHAALLGTIGGGLVAAFLGVPIVLLLALSAMGAPLALVAAVVDEADPFDVASRMIAYATQRLGRLIWYLMVAGVVGCLITAAVESLLLAVVTILAQAGTLDLANPVQGTFKLFLYAIRGIYPAYFFSAATAIYLLLRQDVDGQPFDEIHSEDEASVA